MAGATSFLLKPLNWDAFGEHIRHVLELAYRAGHMALHDALTGLPNRVLSERAAGARAEPAASADSIVATYILDLDQFKHVNDTLGHPTGDKLLKMVADRLQLIIRGMDTVARMGGDEFALVLADAAQQSDIDAVARRIIDVVSEPYEINGRQVVIGTSVGIAIGRASQGLLPDQLIRNADVALYRAKREGRGTFSHLQSRRWTRCESPAQPWNTICARLYPPESSNFTTSRSSIWQTTASAVSRPSFAGATLTRA